MKTLGVLIDLEPEGGDGRREVAWQAKSGNKARWDFVGHCQCVFYLDNEAAKGALIRATTCTVPGRAILQSFIEEEMACQVKVWFSRVPTSSNISDAPSRLDTGEMDTLGVTVNALGRWEKAESRHWGFDDGIRV